MVCSWILIFFKNHIKKTATQLTNYQQQVSHVKLLTITFGLHATNTFSLQTDLKYLIFSAQEVVAELVMALCHSNPFRVSVWKP